MGAGPGTTVLVTLQGDRARHIPHLLIHSFDNHARRPPPERAGRASAPVLEVLSSRRGPALPAPPPRCGELRSPESQPGLRRARAPTPPTLPAAGPPASAPLGRLRPAGFVGQGRRASTEALRLRFRVPSHARRRVPRAYASGSSPPPTHLTRVRTEGPAKPFETAWAAAHPAVSSLFIGPLRTAYCPFIGPFERTVGTRRLHS